jgi:hypothetical protein
MCPFCISSVISVAAGTITTAGLGALFAFARRIPDDSNDASRDDATHGAPEPSNDEQG